MGRLAVVLAFSVALLAAGAPGGRSASAPVTAGARPEALGWPLERFVLTQGFGCTDLALEPRDPACPGGHTHTGLDLAAPAGTPVHAAATGLVSLRRADPGGYGLHLVLEHGGDVTTLYGHLLATAVVEGDLVAAGDLIGRVGSSGNSTGPHLHFEVRDHGQAVDPELLLPAHHQSSGGFE